MQFLVQVNMQEQMHVKIQVQMHFRLGKDIGKIINSKHTKVFLKKTSVFTLRNSLVAL